MGSLLVFLCCMSSSNLLPLLDLSELLRIRCSFPTSGRNALQVVLVAYGKLSMRRLDSDVGRKDGDKASKEGRMGPKESKGVVMAPQGAMRSVQKARLKCGTAQE